MLRIHSIETFGTHEGPGIRLVVFLQGCNFRCLYCHNPDTQSLKGGALLKSENILELLEKQRPYFKNNGGLTVSGGEPLMQREALIDLFKKAKRAGFHIALDTQGSILDKHTKKLLKFVDLVLLDVKHIDNEWHKEVTGNANIGTLKTAKYLNDEKISMWLRYVLVPGLTDQEEFLHKWGEHFKDYTNVERVEILPFHTFGFYKYNELGIRNPLENTPVPTQNQIQKALEIFKKYFREVYIR